jgi:hypothetical protein
MSGKECSVRGERIRFVARLLEGEQMATLCRVCYLLQDRVQDFTPHEHFGSANKRNSAGRTGDRKGLE